MKRSLLQTITLAVLGLSLTACTHLTPERHIGNGVWQRGDGTTFEAPPPLRITKVQSRDLKVSTRQETAREESKDAQNRTVIRELATIFVDARLNVAITLEDGSVHEVGLAASGPVDSSVPAQAAFTGPNGYRYPIFATLHLHFPDPRVDVRISSRGPVSYETSL